MVAPRTSVNINPSVATTSRDSSPATLSPTPHHVPAHRIALEFADRVERRFGDRVVGSDLSRTAARDRTWGRRSTFGGYRPRRLAVDDFSGCEEARVARASRVHASTDIPLAVVWDAVVTERLEQWSDALSAKQQHELRARVSLLEDHGPDLGRPVVDTITASQLAKLEELRARADGADDRALVERLRERREVGHDKSRQLGRAQRRHLPGRDTDGDVARWNWNARRTPKSVSDDTTTALMRRACSRTSSSSRVSIRHRQFTDVDRLVTSSLQVGADSMRDVVVDQELHAVSRSGSVVISAEWAAYSNACSTSSASMNGKPSWI